MKKRKKENSRQYILFQQLFMATVCITQHLPFNLSLFPFVYVCCALVCVYIFMCVGVCALMYIYV